MCIRDRVDRHAVGQLVGNGGLDRRHDLATGEHRGGRQRRGQRCGGADSGRADRGSPGAPESGKSGRAEASKLHAWQPIGRPGSGCKDRHIAARLRQKTGMPLRDARELPFCQYSKRDQYGLSGIALTCRNALSLVLTHRRVVLSLRSRKGYNTHGVQGRRDGCLPAPRCGFD